MTGLDFAILRVFLKASFRSHGAARVEVAAVRGVQGAGNVAFQDDSLAVPGFIGVRNWHSRHQRAGIGVQGVQVDFGRILEK